MNGILLAKLQEAKGTRHIVDDINQLRIAFGTDRVIVQTPRVETNLRSARIPNKAMCIICRLQDAGDMELELSYPIDYPMKPIEVQLLLAESSLLSQLSHSIDSYTKSCDEQGHYPSGINISRHAIISYSGLISPPQIPLPPVPTESTDPPPSEALYYTCKSCRSYLFSCRDLHAHSLESQKPSSFFLVDPPELIPRQELLADQGKILCPKCKSKLGQWSWIGHQCSCCELWISPLFQFHKSKVDIKSESID
jgi:hypothetical protein